MASTDVKCVRCEKWFPQEIMKFFFRYWYCPKCFSHDMEISRKLQVTKGE